MSQCRFFEHAPNKSSSAVADSFQCQPSVGADKFQCEWVEWHRNSEGHGSSELHHDEGVVLPGCRSLLLPLLLHLLLPRRFTSGFAQRVM